jgi:hypothetical protein
MPATRRISTIDVEETAALQDFNAAYVRLGSKAVLLTQLGRLKSVSAIPPIPGMTVMYRSTYAKCKKRTRAAQHVLLTSLRSSTPGHKSHRYSPSV